MDNNGSGGGDRLSEALKRAEAAVRKSEKRADPSPGFGDVDLNSSGAGSAPPPKAAKPAAKPAPATSSPPPSGGDDLELNLDEKPSLAPAAPDGAVKPPSFGEIDLGAGGDGSDLELDAPAEPKKKPAIPKPALLQDEDYDDDGWAEGKKPAQQAPAVEKPAGEQMKVRRAAPGAPAGAPAAAPDAGKPAEAAPAPPPPAEREGPSIRVAPIGPRRDWGPIIKIALIVILAAGLIGGGIFGFLKWRDSVAADEQAQLDAMNQGSLDALKKEALRKEQLGN